MDAKSSKAMTECQYITLISFDCHSHVLSHTKLLAPLSLMRSSHLYQSLLLFLFYLFFPQCVFILQLIQSDSVIQKSDLIICCVLHYVTPTFQIEIVSSVCVNAEHRHK